ncbi:MAG: hypothetical protein HQM06_17625 [Magnetococcales bacterium]|nr:hypothetical protein [Magnetococcales bacterium]
MQMRESPACELGNSQHDESERDFPGAFLVPMTVDLLRRFRHRTEQRLAHFLEVTVARIRTIKPEFWTSEQVVECSVAARLLFIGLWNFCDDGGIHPASAKRLKMEVYPSDDFTVQDVSTMVQELIDHGLLAEYMVDDQPYWRVTGWHHQRIDQPNFKFPLPDGSMKKSIINRKMRQSKNVVSTIPPHQNDMVSPIPHCQNDVVSPGYRRGIAEVSHPEGKGMEGKGERSTVDPGGSTMRDLSVQQSASSGEYPAEFEAIWKIYPQRVGSNPKRRAYQAWSARLKSGITHAEICAGLERYKRYLTARGKTGSEFVLQAATFFGPELHFRNPWGMVESVPSFDAEPDYSQELLDDMRRAI